LRPHLHGAEICTSLLGAADEVDDTGITVTNNSQQQHNFDDQPKERTMERNLKKAIAVLVLGVAGAAPAFGANSKPAAVGQFYSNGVPTSPPIAMPNCRSCKVTQTGPNSYTIKVPNNVRQQLGMPPAPTSKK
jgi:hypothetical protein